MTDDEVTMFSLFGGFNTSFVMNMFSLNEMKVR